MHGEGVVSDNLLHIKTNDIEGAEDLKEIFAARQPIWLTTEGGNPNGAQVLFLIDGAEPGDINAFERACLVFDGRDQAALESARLRWKAAKEARIVASYWRESAAGKWEKQA